VEFFEVQQLETPFTDSTFITRMQEPLQMTRQSLQQSPERKDALSLNF